MKASVFMIIASVSLLANTAFAANWVEVPSSGSQFNSDDIVREDALYKVWVMRVMPKSIVLKHIDEYPDPDHYSHSMLYNVYNCNDMSSSNIYYLNYSTDGSVMFRQQVDVAGLNLRKLVPDSNGYNEAQAICVYIKKTQKLKR